jgi:hypothetical protein
MYNSPPALTIDSARGYTQAAMKAQRAELHEEGRGGLGRRIFGGPGFRLGGLPQRALLAAGSAWEAVRFFIVLHVLGVLFLGGGVVGRWMFPWLLFGGSGSLLAAAGGTLLAAFPKRYEALLGLLRLGKVLGIFSFVLLVVSGALGEEVDRAVASIGPLVILLGPLMLGIFALDLLLLVFLFGLRAEGSDQPTDVEVPGYDETEVGHYH